MAHEHPPLPPHYSCIEELAQLLALRKRVVFVTGAGLSAASGVCWTHGLAQRKIRRVYACACVRHPYFQRKGRRGVEQEHSGDGHARGLLPQHTRVVEQVLA
jgi:hypothetical protein